MALRPGRWRSSVAPIITKGLVYPLQNQLASKSATHGFASKSDTQHNNKGVHLHPFVVGGDRLEARNSAPKANAAP